MKKKLMFKLTAAVGVPLLIAGGIYVFLISNNSITAEQAEQYQYLSQNYEYFSADYIKAVPIEEVEYIVVDGIDYSSESVENAFAEKRQAVMEGLFESVGSSYVIGGDSSGESSERRSEEGLEGESSVIGVDTSAAGDRSANQNRWQPGIITDQNAEYNGSSQAPVFTRRDEPQRPNLPTPNVYVGGIDIRSGNRDDAGLPEWWGRYVNYEAGYALRLSDYDGAVFWADIIRLSDGNMEYYGWADINEEDDYVAVHGNVRFDMISEMDAIQISVSSGSGLEYLAGLYNLEQDNGSDPGDINGTISDGMNGSGSGDVNGSGGFTVSNPEGNNRNPDDISGSNTAGTMGDVSDGTMGDVSDGTIGDSGDGSGTHENRPEWIGEYRNQDMGYWIGITDYRGNSFWVRLPRIPFLQKQARRICRAQIQS